jgi:hypothetical protein
MTADFCVKAITGELWGRDSTAHAVCFGTVVEWIAAMARTIDDGGHSYRDLSVRL